MSEIDPKLSRLYREASAEEPPAVLDAVILAAAQNHVEKSQRREASQRLERAQGRERSFWSRWIAPAGAIATLALGVSIALLVEREQPGTSDATATRQLPPRPQTWPPAPIAETAKPKAHESATTEASAKKEAPAAAAPAQTPESIAPAQAPAPAVPEQAPDSGVPAQAPVSAAPPRAPEPVAPAPAAPAPSAEEAFQAESRAKRATAAPKAVESKSSRESNAAGDAATGGSAAGAPAAPAAAGRLAPLRQQADQRSPEAWLEEISRLRREGRDIEAAEQLAQFRKAYPAHAVPEHLLK